VTRPLRLTLALVVSLHALPLAASITVSIIKPANGALTPDNMTIWATVSSTNSLQSVTGSVAGRNASLTFSMANNRWEGTLSLTGLPRGNQQLTVTAQDVLAATGSANVTFVHDNPPTLNITAPLDYSVARPLIHVTVSCSDDDPAGCTDLFVDVSAGLSFSPMVHAQSSIDQDIPLDAYEGQETTIQIRGIDSAGQTTSVVRYIFVDSSNRIVDVADVGGWITDAQSDRILFLDTDSGPLKVRDRMGGTDTTIPAVMDRYPTRRAFLSPHGAIFQTTDGQYGGTTRVLDFRDGTLTELGILRALRVSGQYAVLLGTTAPMNTPPDHLYLRDLGAGTQVQIPVSNSQPGDVVADGTIAFWENATYNIFLYKMGTAMQITNVTAGLLDVYPRTDGTRAVYTQDCTSCPNPGPGTFGQSKIILNDGAGGETTLSTYGSDNQGVNPDDDYQIANGWVAFTQPDAGLKHQVWLRSPMGSEQQLSLAANSSRIDLLTGNGEVTFVTKDNLQLDAQRLLKTGSASPFQLNSGQGKSFNIGGQWHVAIGRSLFAYSPGVVPSTTTLTSSSNPSVVGDNVTFTATVGPAGATGTVYFRENVTILATVPLSGGTASFSTSSLTNGPHTIVAIYSGDGTYPSSKDTLIQNVLLPTTTALGSSANPSTVGQNVTFTATVNPVISGNIEFRDGSTTLAVVPTNMSGVATYSTASLSGGTHAMTAFFQGTTVYASSTSPVLSQVVQTPFGAPQGLSATATSASQVVLTWVPVAGAHHYEVARNFNDNSYATIATPLTASFTDNTVSANTTYLYVVRAIDASSNPSPYSNLDLATTVMFSDDPLVPGLTIVRATHIAELRTAVNAVRLTAGLRTVMFTDPDLTHVLIKAVHIQELRTALDSARMQLGLPALSYTDTTLTPGSTMIKAAHVQQLRDGCK